MAGEVEVADDLRAKQAQGVGAARIDEARLDLAAAGGAAEIGVLFKNNNAQTGAREVGRRCQTVVPGPYDDGVETLHATLTRSGQAVRHGGITRVFQCQG